ncbi:hypothetical protein CHS0354_007264 [Potamilus streckersoni]|uniref:Uncharacterized protein n=1 Tax=Potamilus streckersoni TaxID=2493646 RepID=A0AAE0TD82_9BIVA|nr:hypothetical protein CHS0354_007264 [Potamilus streckersoni]
MRGLELEYLDDELMINIDDGDNDDKISVLKKYASKWCIMFGNPYYSFLSRQQLKRLGKIVTSIEYTRMKKNSSVLKIAEKRLEGNLRNEREEMIQLLKRKLIESEWRIK